MTGRVIVHCVPRKPHDLVVIRTGFRGLTLFQQKKVKGQAQGQKVNCMLKRVYPINVLTKYGRNPIRDKENRAV